MGQVNTVRGPVDAEQLGATLMHEHVFVRSPEVGANWPTGWDRAEQVSQGRRPAGTSCKAAASTPSSTSPSWAWAATSSSSRRWPPRSRSHRGRHRSLHL